VTPSFQAAVGYIAGFISIAAYVPYARETIRGAARPNRATWVIWSVVGGLLFASYNAAAGGPARWVPLSDALGPALMAVLAIYYGEGGWNWFDLGCLTLAGFSVVGWVLTGSPMVSMSINLFLCVLGAIPTFRIAFYNPTAEPTLVWRMFLLGNVLNLLAIETWSWSSAIYPVYAVLAASLVNVLICRPALGRVFHAVFLKSTSAFERRCGDGKMPGSPQSADLRVGP
jgi:hypothetical protein